VLASRVVDPGFEPDRVKPTATNLLVFVASLLIMQHLGEKDWLAQNWDNVSE